MTAVVGATVSVGLAVGVAALTAVGTVVPGPAAAASDRPPTEWSVGLSVDGETFTDELDVPVFDPSVTWVPGDRRSGRLLVRNEAEVDTDLSLALTAADTIPSWLEVETYDGSTWRTVGADDIRARTVPVRSGEVHAVLLRLTMADSAPQQAMQARTGIGIRVRLSEAGDSSASSPGGATGGALPDTGAPLGPLTLALGAAFLVGGVGVLRARSRP